MLIFFSHLINRSVKQTKSKTNIFILLKHTYLIYYHVVTCRNVKNDNSTTIHDFDKIKRKTLETRQWSTTKKKIITDIKSGALFLGETIFVGVKRFISLLLHNNYYRVILE